MFSWLGVPKRAERYALAVGDKRGSFKRVCGLPAVGRPIGAAFYTTATTLCREDGLGTIQNCGGEPRGLRGWRRVRDRRRESRKPIGTRSALHDRRKRSVLR